MGVIGGLRREEDRRSGLERERLSEWIGWIKQLRLIHDPVSKSRLEGDKDNDNRSDRTRERGDRARRYKSWRRQGLLKGRWW